MTPLLMTLFTAGCSPQESDETPGVDLASSDGEVPARAPAPTTEFLNLDGDVMSLSSFEDRVLVVNFWGTWCVPCRREIPELVQLYDLFDGRAVEIIGIAVDSGEPEDIRAFADRYDVQYRLWQADMATVMADFQAVGYPFTLLVDRSGRIANEYYGPQTLELLAGEIESLLEE